ncbi:hypothetical protein; putative epxorted protein [Bradyrhizobium sp. ORS 278]|uniref:hypothetical protein n=1 Tax=Bradyrhizobium sp. (strain ORS 278) TaxID=114615 RepID=UPI00015081A8|nr:hypothetical protein [Bradyrhizobium sp. ORS 278]CAL79384.1 hypothetical protein; putative epxorted protein [Bradyrhizobium sp. ORS 278]
MSRFTMFVFVMSLVAASLAAAPAQAGYFILRWDNTGICQVWNEALTFRPVQWPSRYQVISRPVPTLSDAVNLQVRLRRQGRCTL